MNESVFWQVIESAWATYPALDATRKRAISLNQSDALQQLAIVMEQAVVPAMGIKLMALSREDLKEFIRLMEYKMYQLDTPILFQYTRLSEVCFIHARAIVIGLGKTYFDLVQRHPSKVTPFLEAEYIATLAYKVYEEQFGQPFEKFVKHSIITRSNETAWAQQEGC
ncbi:MAG: hypothetical protein AAFV95_05510 [Bacteroidota bacterium]